MEALGSRRRWPCASPMLLVQVPSFGQACKPSMICGRRQKSGGENLSVCWRHSPLGNLQSEIDSVAFFFPLPVIAPGYEITRERPEIADPQAARAVARAGVGASSGIDVAHGVNFHESAASKSI